MNVKEPANQPGICVVGLGYVGLPLAIAFAGKFKDVLGFDINEHRINQLINGHDVTREVTNQQLSASGLKLTSNIEDITNANLYVITVPTPIDKARRPDLTEIIKATEIIGTVLKKGAVVVYESTVYPGVTEEICGPVLERVSGLKQGVDFKLGYSPERINPGDKKHCLQNIVKVVSAEDDETLEFIAQIYGSIVDAGIYRANSIKVAEAAKVIENTQRDLNIALMNELAIIFGKMGVRTADVLEAACTKWNFHPFHPGLVGGHCIGVDPYYLTYKAEELGYHPQIILAGRRINDYMGRYIAEQTIKCLAKIGNRVCGARVGIMGLTFKENVPDLRNSRVPDIIKNLREYGITTLIHDPLADKDAAQIQSGLEIIDLSHFKNLDAIILAVGHKEYLQYGPYSLVEKLKGGKGVILDVKSIFKADDFPDTVMYWSL